MSNESLFIEVFGKENLEHFATQKRILKDKEEKLQELSELRQKASDVFKVEFTTHDIVVSVSAGVLLGIGNALFKDFVPQKGPLRHNHGTTRTPVDYGIPKPPNFKGSVNNLHRQIGPSHDIFRFKKALELMKGDSTDFKLWGSTATKILGHELKSGNLKLNIFRELGGFKIPTNPKAELLNHLLIDFFTRTSLPIPGSSYLADSSPEMAKIMLIMYKNGVNLKTEIGNLLGFTLVQIIIHGYTFLFKAIPETEFNLANLSPNSAKTLAKHYFELTQNNEFHTMMMLSHGSSFLLDSIITLSSKSYAGLFQLNYFSLLAFSKHVLQYMFKNAKEYNSIIQEAKEKASEIAKIDNQWQNNFRIAFEKNINKKNFQSILDKDEWLQNTTKIENFSYKIRSSLNREKLLLKKLKSDDE